MGDPLNFFVCFSTFTNSINKSNKMVRDINAPKRPLNGYMRYINTIRAEVEAETGLNGIQVTPHLSARWNALSDEEKNTYNKVFAKEMVKHKKVMAAYKKTKSYKEFQAAKKAKKFGKKPKDKTAPKRPLTAFFVFANTIRDSVRQNNPEASIGEIGKILGQEWNSLDESAKQSYQAKANKNKEKYAKTLTKYQKSKKYAEYQEKLSAWKQAKKIALKEAKKAAKTASTTSNKKRVVRRRR